MNLERLAHNKAFTVAPNKIRDLQQRFDEGAMRMAQAMRQFLLRNPASRTDDSTRLHALDLRRLLDHKKQILAHSRQGLISGTKTCLAAERSRFELAVGKIDALSPLAILGRGFALCRDAKGTILKNAADVSCGDQVSVTLALGSLECEVKNIE